MEAEIKQLNETLKEMKQTYIQFSQGKIMSELLAHQQRLLNVISQLEDIQTMLNLKSGPGPKISS